MKVSIIFYMLVISTTLRAQTLNCAVAQNTKVIYSQKINIPNKNSFMVPEIEGFRIKINNYGNSQFEFEVFDPSVPARTYSRGVLRSKGDILKWALWSRDILLEAACSL